MTHERRGCRRSAGHSRCSRRTPSRCCWPGRGRHRRSLRSPAVRRRTAVSIDARPALHAVAIAVQKSAISGVIRMPSETSLISSRLDLLAQVLRRAPDHQAADEDRQQHVEQDRVKAGADATEDHLAGAQVGEWNRAADTGEGFERAVHGATGGDGRDHVKERRSGDAEALLLAFQVAAGRAGDDGGVRPAACCAGRTVGLGDVTDDHRSQEHDHHR